MATVKENRAAIERLQSDAKDVARATHDLTKLLMQDRTGHALTTHRAKWKRVLEKLEAITQQGGELEDGSGQEALESTT